MADILSELADAIKAGRRHSKGDVELLDKLRSIVKDLDKLAVDLGAEVHEEAKVVTSEEGEAPAKSVSVSDVSVQTDTVKAMSLDEQVAAVREYFYRHCRNERRNRFGDNATTYDEPFEQSLPICAAVYPDAAIVTVNGVYWRAGYTFGDAGAIVDSRETWERVEKDWVAVTKTWQWDLPSLNTAVKALGEGRLGMYAVVWGDGKATDLSQEYFTKETEELESIFKSIGKLPLLFHHAMDGEMKTNVVGVVDTLKRDDIGLWAEAIVDRSNRYNATIYEMAKRGLLGPSSGTLPGARRADGGEIKRWPIVEISLTPEPCEWRMRTQRPPQELKALYIEAGLELPESAEQGDEESRSTAIKAELELLNLIAFDIDEE